MTAATNDCGRCASPLEVEDLRCPVCNQAALRTFHEDLDQTVVEVLRCRGCGAAVSYDVRVGEPACAFCGSVMKVEVPDDPMEQVQFLLPFTVEKPEAESAYRRWLEGLGWFRPGDLRQASRLESMTPLWWAGWVFDAAADVTWAADSNAGARRSDWAPHAGRTRMEFDDVVASASRGLAPEETAFLIPSYDLGSAEAAPEEPTAGSTVEQFDLKRSSARERVRSFIRRTITDRLQRGTIPGNRFRNVHATAVLRGLTTRRFAFPSYVLAYRYRGRLYRVVVSGQDASRLMGTAPYSVAKILAVIFGGLAAVAILVALVAAL
jgi:hypothetical protein